jgi:hypothetical protein
MMNTRKLIVAALVAGLVVLAARKVEGNVNLELRTEQTTVQVGEVLEIGLYAVSDGPPEIVRGMNVILQWEPVFLQLAPGQPFVDNGPYDWLLSGFFDDSAMDGLNDTWDDGDAYYQAVGNFAGTAEAGPEGLLVTTFRFNALDETLTTEATIPLTLGDITQTEVFGEEIGVDVLGTVGSVAVAVEAAHWGTLAIDDSSLLCGVSPGATATVLLTVSDLVEPIGGVQALIGYDSDVLSVVGVLPGDGAGSPWDSAVEVHEAAEGDTLTYALVLLQSGSDQDAVVARIEFLYNPGAAPEPGTVTLLDEAVPLATEITQYPDGFPVIPQLGLPVSFGVPGDTDADGDIDLDDYTSFEACLGGPGAGYAAPECCNVDFDLDTDIDLHDFAEFAESFSP